MKNLIQFFEENTGRYADNPYIWEKREGAFRSTSYGEMKELVRRFAAGLMGLGVGKGDRLALLAEGRSWWVVAEMALFHLGAIDVPLSIQLNEPADLIFRLKHSGTRMVIVSGSQRKKITAIRNELPDLEKIILMDREETYGEMEVYMGDLIEEGSRFLAGDPSALGKVAESVGPDDVANICYTSGTTADPKGIMLTHRNYTSNTEHALSVISIPDTYRMFLFLPWDHSFAHTAGLFTIMATGASLAALELGKTSFESRKNISKNIREIKPHLMFSVPTIARNFRSNIENGVREKGKLTWSLFSAGMRVAYRYNGIGWDRGKGLRSLLKPVVGLFDKVVFRKVRNAMGGNMEFFIGGGALLDIELQRFFYAIGIPMYQGYGLTEASPMISINSPDRHKLGSSGRIPENMEIRICDDEGHEVPPGEKGEIVIRGENVMKGYWKNEAATAETIREDWLFTGDMGYMDPDGFLYVLGRYKSLLIGDDGEKYSPEGIEEAFAEQSPFISQCLLHNNQGPYTVALVFPDAEALGKHLRAEGIDPASDEARTAALRLLDREIREYRANGRFGDLFPQRWIPASVGILSEGFTLENKLMNPTFKVVRPKVESRYEDLFTYLYTPESKRMDNPKNMEAVGLLLTS